MSGDKESLRRILISEIEDAVSSGNLARRRYLLDKIRDLDKEQSRAKYKSKQIIEDEKEYMRLADERARLNNYMPTNLVDNKKQFWKI